MMKMIASWLVLAGLAGAAFAQPAGGSAAGGAAPAAGAPAPPAVDPQGQQPAQPSAEAHPALSPAEAHKLCVEAMNADKAFAAEIVKVADERAAQQRDADTVAAHKAADAHIQKNERHVIYGYAAMWIVAALFVIFLWRRQQGLKAEIASLRRDLEAAAEDGKPAEQRS
jgi:hypothetical protein